MYRVATANYETSFSKYVIINDNFEIFEPALIYSEKLHASNKISTIYNYLLKISKFLNYLESKNMTYDMVSEDTIVKYINYLKGYEEAGVIPIEEKLSGATINTHLTVLANFYQTLSDFDFWEGKSPFSYVEGFKATTAYRSFLYHASINKNTAKRHKIKANVRRGYNLNIARKRKSKDEIDKFRSYLDNERDLLIFDILYNTGMRIAECLNLSIYDYSEPGIDGWGTIRIIEREINDYNNLKQAASRQIKTGSREIVVLNDLLERIEKYVTYGREYIEGETFLFVSRKGNKGTPLSRADIEYIFRKVSKLSGIKITPHMLRHTHITELTEAGFDELYIKLRVGHSHTSSTRIYQHPSLEVQAEALKRFGGKRVY